MHELNRLSTYIWSEDRGSIELSSGDKTLKKTILLFLALLLLAASYALIRLQSHAIEVV